MDKTELEKKRFEIMDEIITNVAEHAINSDMPENGKIKFKCLLAHMELRKKVTRIFERLITAEEKFDMNDEDLEPARIETYQFIQDISKEIDAFFEHNPVPGDGAAVKD